MHRDKLTYGVSTAELCGDDVLHVAMKTKKDLNRVDLHLQSAGQVHHLIQTELYTQAKVISYSQTPLTKLHHKECVWHMLVLPCAPEAVDHPPCHTRPAACARLQQGPTQSPHSPPDVPSGDTNPDLTTGDTY